MMFIQTPDSFDINGNIAGDPSDYKPGENDSLSPSNSYVHEVMCPPKTQDGQREPTQKTTQYNAIQMPDSQRHYGHKPGKTENQQVESSQYVHNKPYIWIPVGSCQHLIAFLIDRGAQPLILMQQDYKKLGVQLGWQKIKITGVNRASVTCR